MRGWLLPGVALAIVASPFVVLVVCLGWEGLLAIGGIAAFAIPAGVASR